VAERPRLAVFRSLRHVYAQVIDDSRGVTLVAASSLDAEVREQREGKPKSDISSLVGEIVARRAVENGITTVVFDRGGVRYHGRVQALANGARRGGLTF
jgi:large subunit ribosomal protein L18